MGSQHFTSRWMQSQTDLAKAMPGAATALLGVVYIFGAWRCALALREINPHWLMIALLVEVGFP